MKKLFREPLVHFFVLGAGLFVLFAWLNDDALQSPSDIVVDTTRVNSLKTQFERVWRRQPTQDELRNLVDNWVREEILYREGLSMGLDQNDPVTRRRVAQKMEFIAEELVDTSADTDELETWFVENADSYRQDPRFTFQQLYLDPSAPGADFNERVDVAVKTLASGKLPAGDATLLPGALQDATLAEVRRTFGEKFAQSLQGLAIGEWDGPVASGFGVHFVKVESMQAARLPALDEVRAEVERDYRVERMGELKNNFIDALRERYNVIYDDNVELADKQQAADRL